MNKIVAVARSEYLTAVRSKAFLVGIILMPLMMGGGIIAQLVLKNQVDTTDRRCAIVDPTGAIFPALASAAEERNSKAIWREEEEGRKQLRPRFLLERYEPLPGERADVALSERIEKGQLDGFLLLGEQLLDPEGEVGQRPLSYHTDEPTFTELPGWLDEQVNSLVRHTRFAAASLDPDFVAKLDRHIPLRTYGLAEARADGSVEEAQEDNKLRTFGVPAIAMFLLFMLIMTSAPALMNQVLEEKMQRISEVLVSAVTPFQLMMGKLLGSVLVAFTLALLYIGAVVWATHHFGVAGMVPISTYVWFVAMLALSLLMYGSIFSSLGSACSELRDAQSMMMPAMLLIMIPLFAWTSVLESPNGAVAHVLTFLPTATPLILLLRLNLPPGPPLMEVLLALVVCIASAVAFVWAGSKIFRIGVLSQGQTPSYRKVLSWIFAR